MQDDQIGPKIAGLAPADMARLPPSIHNSNIFFSCKQPRLSFGTPLTLILPCFTRESFNYYIILLPSFLDFYEADADRGIYWQSPFSFLD
jgi:hypothetical protein